MVSHSLRPEPLGAWGCPWGQAHRGQGPVGTHVQPGFPCSPPMAHLSPQHLLQGEMDVLAECPLLVDLHPLRGGPRGHLRRPAFHVRRQLWVHPDHGKAPPWAVGSAGHRGRQAGSSSAPVSPQDGCGANDSQPTFKVLTENVVCGKSGVTCSRAIKIFLGVSGPGGASPHLSPQGPTSWTLGAPGTQGLDSGAKGRAEFSQKPDPQPLVQFPPCSGMFCQRFLEGRPPADNQP